MKKSIFILIAMLPWIKSSWGQPVAPLQAGETIATAFVLSGPLPLTASGSTAGFLDNYDEACPYPGTSTRDVVYSYTPVSTVNVNIDLCGSSYDTKVYVYENAASPGNPLFCNDDFYFDPPCGLYTSKIEDAQLTAGNTYYIVIDGFSEFDYGNYAMTISQVSNCTWGTDLTCPAGSVAENEACGANTNGGCDMAPGTETWITIPSAGGTVCGTTWADGGNRDSDWFSLTLTQSAAVTLTANADREIYYGSAQTSTPGSPTCATMTGIITPFKLAGPCNETSLNLGILSPGTYWFVAGMTVTDGFPCTNHYWIHFDVAPFSCSPPADLSAGAVTPGTAALSWTETGTATAWQYQYGPAGFTPAASGISTAVDPVTVSGLSANTNYDFYVRANCSPGNYSAWSGPESFHTPCNPVSALPWSENFDAMPGIGNNILPSCWVAESFTGIPWYSGNAASNSYNNPCSAPNYVFVDNSNYPEDKFLITPGFTLNTSTSYDFSFNWTGDGFAGWTGDVRVNSLQTGTGATILGSPFVTAGTTTVENCTQATRSFTPVTGGTYYFMVRVSNTSVPHYLGFDDFTLHLSPACQPPINLAANPITSSGANLSWTPGGSETSWEYSIGPAPLPSPAGPGIATASATVNPATGLSGNTDYQFYVRAACGPGYSSWAGPYGFHTLCDPVSSLPWTDSFESAWPPPCWTDTETADFGWDQDIFGSARSGTQWAYCNLSGAQLITPSFYLTSPSRLTFWYRVEDSSYPQDLAVKIGKNVIYQITGATNGTYKEVQVSLAAYTGQTISISFTGETGTGGVDYGICLDDVSVKLISNWTGLSGKTWNSQGNWSTGAVPGPDDMVIIPSIPAGGNFPEIPNGFTAECYIITVEAGATVRVKPGGTLNIKNP